MSINAGVCPQCRGHGFVERPMNECHFTWDEGVLNVQLWYKNCPTCNSDGSRTWHALRAPKIHEWLPNAAVPDEVVGGEEWMGVHEHGEQDWQEPKGPKDRRRKYQEALRKSGFYIAEPGDGHQKGED